MSRRTRRSSRSPIVSFLASRPATARAAGPAWDRRSEPRGRLRRAPWPRPLIAAIASIHRLSPGACEAGHSLPVPLDCAREGLPQSNGTNACIHLVLWRHRYHANEIILCHHPLPSLARFGLEALANCRVEEDTGAVPRSVTSSVAFGRNGLSSSNGRLVRNRPFAHSDRFSGHKGAGNAGRAMRPQPRVQDKKHTSVVTTGSPETPGLPAQWF